MAQYARSEAELEQIMDGLHEQEVCHNANTPKNDNFQMKNCDSFLISAQNIDCGYMLEQPH